MPIVLAPQNTQLKVVRISAEDKTKKHLESLGITVGGEISVLSSSGGTVVCKIKEVENNTRVILCDLLNKRKL